MPEVHFVGEIMSAHTNASAVSITWAVVAGNNSWFLKDGFHFSETQTSLVSRKDAKAVINHPLDVYYETASSEGWPRIVCEVWDRSEEGMRGFVGCGSTWLPSTPGECMITIPIWKPISSGLESLSGKPLLFKYFVDGNFATIFLSYLTLFFHFWGGVADMWLPYMPDLVALRELTCSPFLRSEIQVDSVGSANIKITTAVSGFSTIGVTL